MPLSIRPFQPADAPAWDAFARAHPHGSPFHLTAWKQSIEQTFHYQPLYLVAEDAGRIRGVLPLFLVSSLLSGKALISSPFAVYGGPLADGPEALAAFRAALEVLGKERAADYIELRNAHAGQVLGFAPVDRYVTFTQEIGPDREAVLEAIPRKTRAAVRKSFKSPYTMRRATGLAAFEELYAQSLRRLGTPCFPYRHFVNLQRNFGKECEIFEVLLENQVVAAVLTFYFGEQVLPYYGASDPAFNAQAPNNYMYYELMAQSGEQGLKLYDFGRSKKSGSGSFDFKAHWGMQMRDLPYEMLLVRRKELPHYSPNNPRFHFAIEMWKRIPMPLARAVGPFLIRQVP